jgi:L-alanine-DL-glutamate epimerase-like enolase superfamily enzyme
VTRLARHQLYAYRLPYARPVRWSDIVEEASPFVLLRLTADDGSEGVGEIAVKPTWCGVTAKSLIATVEDVFLPMLQRLDLADPANVRAALDGVPENTAAKTLIDNACWDLFAARAGKPLWQLWNASAHVPLSFAVTRATPDAMADEAARMVETHGFETLKFKGGQGIATDVAGIRAVRAAVGDAIRFYVDANGAYPVREAADYARAIADTGAVLLEDPCPLVPDAAFAQFAAQSPLPILVDFGCTSLRDAGLFLEHGARALSIKPGRFGLTQSRAMLDRAQAADCAAVVGLMGESALGTIAGLSFAATIARPILPAELSWYMAMTRQIVHEPLAITDGAVTLPDTPSLAALVDWDAVRGAG